MYDYFYNGILSFEVKSNGQTSFPFRIGITSHSHNEDVTLNWTDIEKYKNALDSFLTEYADRIKEYGFLGGHFIQENGCDDTKQEDYLSNQSTYFNPLSLQVVEDMQDLCTGILQGNYDNAMIEDEFSWSHQSARISGHFS